MTNLLSSSKRIHCICHLLCANYSDWRSPGLYTRAPRSHAPAWERIGQNKLWVFINDMVINLSVLSFFKRSVVSIALCIPTQEHGNQKDNSVGQSYIGNVSCIQIISKLIDYVLKFSAVLSLKVSEAVNTPCWSYICSFEENRHGFNN